MMNRPLFAAMLAVLLSSWPAFADPLPGDACPETGRVMSTGGAESAGVGGMMVCEGGTWKPILGFDGAGQITKIGNQTCDTGQVISFDGAKWACADSGGGLESVPGLDPPPADEPVLTCTQRSGTNNASCNHGEIMTGGGCLSSSGTANLRTNRPSAAGTWSCTYSGGTVTAYAICCTL